MKQGRYSHARQMKRAQKETKKLKNYLGRVTRDIRCKATVIDTELEELLLLSERLLVQKREDKHKLYSVHAPEVECIAKGKAHKRYEFCCKVSVATTSRHNWVVGIQALHGNPYDGHTLKDILEQVERLTNYQVREACCGANLRKLMAAFFLPFLEIRRFLEKITNNFQRTIKTETPVLMNAV